MNLQHNDIEIIEDPLENQYLSKLEKTLFTCKHCESFPLIAISKEHPDSILVKCFCINSNSTLLKITDFFQLPWLENEIQSQYQKEQQTISQEEQTIKRTKLLLNCLSIWNSITKSEKTIKKIYNINNIFQCSHSSHSKQKVTVDYFCKTCNKDICEQCYNDIEHKSHDVIKLNEYLNIELLNKKKNFILDVKEIMEKHNKKAYNEINNIISSKSKTLITNEYNQSLQNLFQSLINNKIINECFYYLFLIHFKLYEICSITSNLCFSLLQNIKELSHVFVPPSYPFSNNLSSSSETNEINSHINKIHKHLQNSFILSYEEDDNLFSKLQNYYMNDQIHFNQISLRLGRNYSHDQNKKRIIKQILLLNNFDFALATSSKTIKIFNPMTMSKIQKCSKHTAPVNYLCSFGIKYFLSCSDDGSVIKWKHRRLLFTNGFNLTIHSFLKNGIRVINNLNNIYYIKSFQDDSKVILLEKGNIIKIYNTNKEKKPFTLYKIFTQQSANITSMLIYKDNTVITLTNDDNSIRFWDIEEEKLDKKRTICNLDTNDKVNSIKLLNEKMLIVGGRKSFVVIDLYMNCVMWKMNGEDIINVSAVNQINKWNFIIATKKYFIVYNVNMDKIEETKKVSHSQFGNISDICVMIGNSIIISTTTESQINKFVFAME